MKTIHFIGEKRKCSTNVEQKSAVTDQADIRNCVIDWEIARDRRWVRETTWIRILHQV